MPLTRELVALPSGISLDTSLYAPQNITDRAYALVVCLHPWSRLGGSIGDPVLSYLSESLIQQHDDLYVLRYNSRGVGKSSGWASFSGFSEGQDLQDIVQWALNSLSNIKSVILLGYSHGSLITSLHPVLPLEIKTYHILLSYPLGPRAFLTAFNSNTYTEKLQSLVRDPHSNVLVIYGDCDEFTGDTRYAAWVEELKRESDADNLRVERVEGASHLWGGNSIQILARIVAEWVPDL